MSEFVLNPDRELAEDVLVMGLLVNGRTTLDDFVFTERTRTLADLLREFGLVVEEKGTNTILSGVGFSYKVPPLLKIPESENAMALLLALASRDEDTLYTVTGSERMLQKAKTFLSEVFGAVIESEGQNASGRTLAVHFVKVLPVLKETREGCIPYLAKNAVR